MGICSTQWYPIVTAKDIKNVETPWLKIRADPFHYALLVLRFDAPALLLPDLPAEINAYGQAQQPDAHGKAQIRARTAVHAIKGLR